MTTTISEAQVKAAAKEIAAGVTEWWSERVEWEDVQDDARVHYLEFAKAALTAAAQATPPTEADMRAFGASEGACYKWPDDTLEHKTARAAYCQGAADYGGAVQADPSKYQAALEQIALLDENDGHELTVTHAFQAIAIATSTLGKHPSEIYAAQAGKVSGAKAKSCPSCNREAPEGSGDICPYCDSPYYAQETPPSPHVQSGELVDGATIAIERLREQGRYSSRANNTATQSKNYPPEWFQCWKDADAIEAHIAGLEADRDEWRRKALAAMPSMD